MDQNKIEILERALKRERTARKNAERILEQKSAELYSANQRLEKSYTELEELLDRTDSQLQGVFENIVDAYVIMDLMGNILKMNDAAVDLLGFENTKENSNLLEFPVYEEKERVSRAFKDLLKDGAITDFQIEIRTRKNEEKIIHVNASIILDQGIPVAAQGIVRDVTKIRNLEIQKEKLLSQLEKSNNELHEYAHVVSHDLKSPLRSISALVSWLKSDNEDKFDKVSLQNLTLIETTIEKMDNLISDVLEYSSIGSNTNELSNVDLNVLVDDLIQFLYKPDHIEFQIVNNLPVVIGDKTKLQQLFQNLMSNAIKFIDKEKGFVKINVEDVGSHYKFSIQDNGIGIEEKHHSKIFQVFQSINKRKDSTGIGLSIVQKIVELHEGEIWLNSKVNEGTTFFFTIKK
ncbi:ATP-binding protein [Seonamhaeicola sp. MEBiC1930]|uniref:sensor histidine kinase n=1 Tax=Seonamhaeicola sp. MEBiC01930 TaxID=2976768 RepID=UPI0032431506